MLLDCSDLPSRYLQRIILTASRMFRPLRPRWPKRLRSSDMLRISRLAVILTLMTTWSAMAETLDVFIDADYSVNTQSAEAIELGVRTALSEVDYTVAGITIRVSPKDNRGNVKRSKRTMDAFLKSDSALALIGGLHSPPYLTHREFMNQNGVLALLPWSAAGPITRAQSSENWIFRLSVDDKKSGGFFIDRAVGHDGCQKVAFLLVETGWGRANNETLSSALEARAMLPATVEYFPAAIREGSAEDLAKRVAAAGADCAVIVALWLDGSIVINALAKHVPSIRVYSHWGILGGEFTQRVSHEARESVSLAVLQTCALRREAEGSVLFKDVLASAGHSGTTVADLKAPTGFVHAYDLTLILIAAIEQAAKSPEWNAEISSKRLVLRNTLQNLGKPINGLLSTYNPPFTPYSLTSLDGHEALGQDDLCLARFREDGRLEHVN